MNTETIPGAGPVEQRVGRGERLGYMYIARRPCGKVSGRCWDEPGYRKYTAKEVAGYIKRGDYVERVERFENDPQPEWICEPGCSKCKQPDTEVDRPAPEGETR